MKDRLDLLIPRELALKLGCIEPQDLLQLRQLKTGTACLVVRDPATLEPVFWPIIPAPIASPDDEGYPMRRRSS